EGWPPRIDDPLPPQRERDPKQHLHMTIQNLNRHHKHRLIRFAGDGNGRGVRWEFHAPGGRAAPPELQASASTATARLREGPSGRAGEGSDPSPVFPVPRRSSDKDVSTQVRLVGADGVVDVVQREEPRRHALLPWCLALSTVTPRHLDGTEKRSRIIIQGC